MSSYLVVTWDGAGNLVSTLGIARRLVERGHDVRLLGHRSIDERCGSHGWRFRPFSHTGDFDSTAVMDLESEMTVMTRELWFSDAPGHDVSDELDREAADVLVVDCMLPLALSAGRTAGVPTAAVFHSPFSGFRGGPMVELMAAGMPLVNAARSTMGLAPVERLADVHDECDLCIVATPREFELGMPTPSNVRFVGPILDGPALTTRIADLAVDDGRLPLVLISLSTSNQGQVPVLQRLIDALGHLPVRVVVTTGPAVAPEEVTPAPNTTVVGFVPHQQVLPKASLVVTHAGLGTVMTALSSGVPLLCLPMGRDQFFNAAQVEALGAGRMIPADTDAGAVAASSRGAARG